MKTSNYTATLMGCVAGGIISHYMFKMEQTLPLTIGMVLMLTFCYIITYRERRERK